MHGFVNGWKPVVYMSYISQKIHLFHVLNISVLNFRICLLMYPGLVIHLDGHQLANDVDADGQKAHRS